MENISRDSVVRSAKSMLGTPFHMNACIPSVGIDCGRMPWVVYKEAGLDMPELPPHWPPDFMNHKMAEGEPYLSIIREKLHEVDSPLPGDLAVFRPARSNCFCHTAIVVKWPKVIHARGTGLHPQVEEADFGIWPLSRCPVRFFSPFFME